jgi:hypothetical protein
MPEGGAAAKCARASWISHRSAWRTATKKKLIGTSGMIVPFGPLTVVHGKQRVHDRDIGFDEADR